MKKTLIVMRHGKAMPLNQDQQDKDRELTTAGAMALDARLPHMLGLLETDATVQIWSSPATRACQTAELLQRALRKSRVQVAKKIRQYDSLWEQDIDAFLNDLRATKADVICAVGHIPFAEDIVDELVGATPPFSTGALGCMEVRLADEDAVQDSARLQWFVQGPVAAHWDTFVQLQATFTQVAEVIEERRSAFFATPEDIETIHRFRTNIRTLRSLLAFIKPWQNAKQNAETQDILREIVRYTSRLRELDVLEKQVNAREDSSPKTLAFCKEEASAERAKVREILASKRISKAFEKAMSSAKNVMWKKRYAERGLPREVVRARFDALIESVSAELDAVDLTDPEQTHDVRKRAKRARYVAEFNTAVLGEDAVDIALGMTAHQDNLGDICDARANIRLTSEFLQQDLPKSVRRELTQAQEQNEAFLNDALEPGQET